MAEKQNISIESLVWQVAEPLAAEAGAELVDVEWLKEGPDWYLRLYIDRAAAPVDIDLCQAVSEKVSDALDVIDPISQNYIFEVSSPGVERSLKRPQDFQRFLDSNVFIKLFSPLEGQKEFCGRLVAFADGQVEILSVTEKGHTIKIPFDKIAKAHLIVDF